MSYKYLKQEIINCKKCPRLVNFREKIAFEKRKQFKNEKYWGKAVPGFGSKKAEILILGLAPAAHGANRTGRVFTGDKSSEFLFKCLYEAKLANQDISEKKNDNLKLINVFITLALKCVPPQDKPNADELIRCSNYLKKEIIMLKKLKTILALGRVAFDSCTKYFNLKKKNYIFKHGKFYTVNKNIKLIACYHPSPRNVNTRRINLENMTKLLKKINYKTTS